MLGWEFPPHISGGLGTACHGIVQALSRADVDVLFVVPRARGDEDAGRARVVGANQIPVEERTPVAPRRVRRLRAEVVEEAGSSTLDLGPSDDGASDARGDGGGWIDEGVGESIATVAAHAPSAAAEPRDLHAEERRSVEVRAIDSLLSPYLDARGYRERLLAAARAERAAAEPAWSSDATRHAPIRLRTGADARVTCPLGEPHVPIASGSFPPQSSSGAPALGSTAVAEPTVRMWIEEAEEPVPDRVTTRLLDFSGAYGGDLFGEVARYALAVEALARRETFDVVHAHDWMAVPAGVAAKRASGKKLVFHVHALEHDRSGDRPDERVRGIEQLGLDEADLVVCVSHYTAGVLKRHYRVAESKLRVVHNALTQRERREQVHAVKPLEEPIVLFLGRITAQKGPEYFLEAAARVARVRPDVKFVVAGSGDRLGSTIELAAKLGLARNTHFTGFLAGADVERMYAMADVYVMPSVSEPFGIAPLEAMALDVPVIVSRQSGVSEVLRSALKVDYWDVQGIAEKILAVLAYPELSRTLQDEGKAEASAMRWDAPAAKLKDAYASLAGAS